MLTTMKRNKAIKMFQISPADDQSRKNAIVSIKRL